MYDTLIQRLESVYTDLFTSEFHMGKMPLDKKWFSIFCDS